jgi:hypothetical protein
MSSMMSRETCNDPRRAALERVLPIQVESSIRVRCEVRAGLGDGTSDHRGQRSLTGRRAKP